LKNKRGPHFGGRSRSYKIGAISTDKYSTHLDRHPAVIFAMGSARWLKVLVFNTCYRIASRWQSD